MGVHLVGGMWVTFNVYCPGRPRGAHLYTRGHRKQNVWQLLNHLSGDIMILPRCTSPYLFGPKL